MFAVGGQDEARAGVTHGYVGIVVLVAILLVWKLCFKSWCLSMSKGGMASHAGSSRDPKELHRVRSSVRTRVAARALRHRRKVLGKQTDGEAFSILSDDTAAYLDNDAAFDIDASDADNNMVKALDVLSPELKSNKAPAFDASANSDSSAAAPALATSPASSASSQSVSSFYATSSSPSYYYESYVLCESATPVYEPEPLAAGMLSTPHPYPDKLRCSWTLTSLYESGSVRIDAMPWIAAPSSRIKMPDGYPFATECGWDFVAVYDGRDVSAPLIAMLSGSYGSGSAAELEDGPVAGSDDVPGSEEPRRFPHIASTGRSLTVVFESDSYVHSWGLALNFTSSPCPGDCYGQGKCSSNGTCVCNEGYGGRDCSERHPTALPLPLCSDCACPRAYAPDTAEWAGSGIRQGLRLATTCDASALLHRVCTVCASHSFAGRVNASHPLTLLSLDGCSMREMNQPSARGVTVTFLVVGFVALATLITVFALVGYRVVNTLEPRARPRSTRAARRRRRREGELRARARLSRRIPLIVVEMSASSPPTACIEYTVPGSTIDSELTKHVMAVVIQHPTLNPKLAPPKQTFSSSPAATAQTQVGWQASVSSSSSTASLDAALTGIHPVGRRAPASSELGSSLSSVSSSSSSSVDSRSATYLQLLAPPLGASNTQCIGSHSSLVSLARFGGVSIPVSIGQLVNPKIDEHLSGEYAHFTTTFYGNSTYRSSSPTGSYDELTTVVETTISQRTLRLGRNSDGRLRKKRATKTRRRIKRVLPSASDSASPPGSDTDSDATSQYGNGDFSSDPPRASQDVPISMRHASSPLDARLNWSSSPGLHPPGSGSDSGPGSGLGLESGSELDSGSGAGTSSEPGGSRHARASSLHRVGIRGRAAATPPRIALERTVKVKRTPSPVSTGVVKKKRKHAVFVKRVPRSTEVIGHLPLPASLPPSASHLESTYGIHAGVAFWARKPTTGKAVTLHPGAAVFGSSVVHLPPLTSKCMGCGFVNYDGDECPAERLNVGKGALEDARNVETTSIFDFSRYSESWMTGGRKTRTLRDDSGGVHYHCCEMWTPLSVELKDHGAPPNYQPVLSTVCRFHNARFSIQDVPLGVQLLHRTFGIEVAAPSVPESRFGSMGYVGGMRTWPDRFQIEARTVSAHGDCSREMGSGKVGIVLYDMWHAAYWHYFHNMFMRAWGSAYTLGLIDCPEPYDPIWLPSSRHPPCTIARDRIVMILPGFPHGDEHPAIDKLMAHLSDEVIYEPAALDGLCFETLVVGAYSELDFNSFVMPATLEMLPKFEQWWNWANGLVTPRLGVTLGDAVAQAQALDELSKRERTAMRSKAERGYKVPSFVFAKQTRLQRPVLTIIDRKISHARQWRDGLVDQMRGWAEERGILTQVVSFEAMSYEESLAVMSNSSIVFGVTGAGFTNQYHMQPGSVSVLIFPYVAFAAFYDSDEFAHMGVARSSFVVKYVDHSTRAARDQINVARNVFDGLLDQALTLGSTRR
ncbi:uncharacterized protein AMSG_11944 [Thecamonas trahens ATCC 50062]|uniref:EGF-like domain-containing protein n=1 Tax=Thecamonas trahens ATCC 50062 TaxID=461836 RepID=A0A0L0DC85_THETB|nr:hypothetical protein AMSG_11944 [Thecamonas trahens ATCC 50062]KNC49850.1 hypothetical protein AMSG_11944 [Thecamonas trahens ATCC 50062]|eukprot:XP_013757444.1 hypothetical protein AMSG_11944 [Thecamonas trahens ATCC 50062]